ncbi:hypothetical protein [Sulfurimonas sp.]|uniref:hypothetical protein n=1 Tax=Sulfurimonas sp. TaxID=2022749 RepID=UPI003D0ECADA
MENKEKSELIAKIVDALYKKLLILTAIGGGFGVLMQLIFCRRTVIMDMYLL